tara:strand:- start:435 stop:641 length:207 start_codon:yes stop_codon:yes gene_type:complete
MDFPSKRILIAAIVEKRELVQMLYDLGRFDDGLAEYMELRRLGGLLRKAINGDPRAGYQGTGDDTPTE